MLDHPGGAEARGLEGHGQEGLGQRHEDEPMEESILVEESSHQDNNAKTSSLSQPLSLTILCWH